MATVYCGVDFHARKQTVSNLTTEDGEIHHHELVHELAEVRSFYAGLRRLGAKFFQHFLEPGRVVMREPPQIRLNGMIRSNSI